MSIFQFFVGIMLLLCWAGRPILYRPVAKEYQSKLSPAFTSIWLMIGLFLTFPFLGHLFVNNWQYIIPSYGCLLSVYKGVSLFYLIRLQQIVNRESTSSSVFLSFISLALGALVNNLFFGEGLGTIKVLCILGLGALGTIFFFKGDAKRLHKKARIAFAIDTIIMTTYMVCDHLAIPQIGWYPYLLISSVFMFLTSLAHGISKKDFRNIIKNKKIVLAGVFYTVTEFFVIFAFINILPVSIASVFLRLSVPVVMIYSAILYKEQSLKNQLVFAITAIALALPIILIRG